MNLADNLESAAPIAAQENLAARTVFKLDRVSVRFGSTCALESVELSIRAGERVALVGPNGSGKTTLLRVLNGLIEPSEGTVQRPATTRQTLLFQRPYMLRATAQSNVALGLWLRGARWRDACKQANEALARVGLATLAQRNARALSAGQQQRVALARAWVSATDVLLLDEPTSSIDPDARREVETLVSQFAAGRRQTLVFSSHTLELVGRLATRVVCLDSGRICSDLPTAEFLLGTSATSSKLSLAGELK
ncbi:MAG TPA: ATP-binding cassette domain-containing protein [Burkholderiaceae bacterium]|nr:ATP-binding cassette domain-containing protein [Burkholderiaceae bacterium]